MSQFVDNCGDARTNPLLNFVHRYTDDKSRWQNQFLEQNQDARFPGMDQFPGQFAPPLHPIEMERKMADEFLAPHELERFDRFERGLPLPPHEEMTHFDPSALPPQVFNDFVRSFQSNELATSEPLENVHLSPQDSSKIRNRSQIMARHFNPDSSIESTQVGSLLNNLNIQETHTNEGWIGEFAKTAKEPNHEFAEMEEIWKRREGTKWAEEFPQDQFEDVYGNIVQKNKESGKDWADGFVNENNQDWKKIAQQAALIDDPKLQNSQFMQFVNKMASGELEVKDGALVPAKPAFADEFLHSEGNKWADQFDEQSWADQFKQFDQGWSNEFFNSNWEEKDYIDQYNEVWNEIQKNQKYQFQDENRYINDPEALQKGLALFDQGNLPEAILALEAAVQQNPTDSNAWCKLGLAHAENDKDNLAILSLEQSLNADPNNLEALMAIAVSHTNEFHQSKAVDSLRLWLIRNPKYSAQFKGMPEDSFADLRQVEKMFLDAARSQPTDPGVHSALGLIYNLCFEYDKAIDCFRAALMERPDDYQLWNKLGATTANSNQGRERAHEAIDAYYRALEKKPTYTRARANLGISHMATSNYIEAAKCFLGALDINSTPHLWDNLKSAFTMMDRVDLVEKVQIANGNVDLFRDEFDF